MLGAYLVDQATTKSAASNASTARWSPAGADMCIVQPVEVHGPHCDFFKAVIDGALDEVARLAAADPTLVKASAVGSTPLAMAVFFGNGELVRFLLNHGAPVDQPVPDATHSTPLHCCVLRSQVEIAEMLLDFGADVDARQIGGFTPLHAAAQNGDVEMARLLLAYRPDVNARHAEGGTALSIAVDWGHGELADLLRQHGASD